MREQTKYRPSIVCLSTDVSFVQIVNAVVTEQGGQTIRATAAETFMTAVDQWFPVLTLLDMIALPHAEWSMAIRRCKVRPQTRGVPIYAFAAELDDTQNALAQEAGADSVWSLTQLRAELATVVDTHISPPTRYPNGWDDVLTAKARAGLHLFNEGDYFEQHELLEEAWMAEERPIREMYQGILQIGVAFLQIERNNWTGALKMFRRGLPKLRGLPATCQGVQVGALLQRAEQIHWEVMQLGAAQLGEFDQTQLPQIAFAE